MTADRRLKPELDSASTSPALSTLPLPSHCLFSLPTQRLAMIYRCHPRWAGCGSLLGENNRLPISALHGFFQNCFQYLSWLLLRMLGSTSPPCLPQQWQWKVLTGWFSLSKESTCQCLSWPSLRKALTDGPALAFSRAGLPVLSMAAAMVGGEGWPSICGGSHEKHWQTSSQESSAAER